MVFILSFILTFVLSNPRSLMKLFFKVLLVLMVSIPSPTLQVSQHCHLVLSITSLVCDVSSSNAPPSSESLNLWQSRLGHPNVNVLKLVMTQCNVPFNSKNLSFCSSCCVGKSYRLPSPSAIVYSNHFN